jgi:hypothetical protein
MTVLERTATFTKIAMNAFLAKSARVPSNATLLTAMNGTEVHRTLSVNVRRKADSMIVIAGMEHAAWNILQFA